MSKNVRKLQIIAKFQKLLNMVIKWKKLAKMSNDVKKCQKRANTAKKFPNFKKRFPSFCWLETTSTNGTSHFNTMFGSIVMHFMSFCGKSAFLGLNSSRTKEITAKPMVLSYVGHFSKHWNKKTKKILVAFFSKSPKNLIF